MTSYIHHARFHLELIFSSLHTAVCSALISTKIIPLKQFSEPVFRSFFRTSAPMKVRDSNLGLIIGIIVAVLVALAVVVCFVTLYRRWKVSQCGYRLFFTKFTKFVQTIPWNT